jgi:hypothetical protein
MHHCEECSLDQLLCNVAECLTSSCNQNVLDLGEWSFLDVENILFDTEISSRFIENSSVRLGCLQMHKIRKVMQQKWQESHQDELECIYDALSKLTYISFDDWCDIAYKKYMRINCRK